MINHNQDASKFNSYNPGDYYIKPVDKTQFNLGDIGPTIHNYNSHPLLQLDSLEALAKRLVPLELCRFIKGEAKINSVFDHQKESPEGKSIEEVFRRIEEPGSWIALYSIDNDPIYKKFVWEVLASARHLVDNWDSVFDVRGYIFISAPPSVVPFHMDRENNFWLQIHGRKKINVWDRKQYLSNGQAVEQFIMSGNLEKVVLKDGMMSQSVEFNCGPGEGVYFPSTTPHMTQTEASWVRPGNGVSVSVGFTFFTKNTRKEAYIHCCNSVLRRWLGMHPIPPNQSNLIDQPKYWLGRFIMYLRRVLRNHTPPAGFEDYKKRG